MSVVGKLSELKIYTTSGEIIDAASLFPEGQCRAVAWLRHFGCVFCKQLAAEMAQAKPELDKLGVSIALVGQGSWEQAKKFQEEVNFPGDVYTDPELKTYEALGFGKSVKSLLNPSMLIRAYSAFRDGLRQGPIQGKAFQNGGVVVAKGSLAAFLEYRDPAPGKHASLHDIFNACRSCAEDRHA
eukprot:jgi/Galph1/658/GphlegSOOS_G5372.1